MIGSKRVLAIVPARGGSKGLPGKNVRDLHGKPLIAWSIDAGRASRYVDELVVSTDSEEIAAVAAKFGAPPPFMRPPELATDTAGSVDVIEHVVNELAGRGRAFDYIVLLEPTSPLREIRDIDDALELFVRRDAEALVSVCRAEVTHPSFMFRVDSSERLTPFLEGGFKPLRRQELTPVFYLEGTVYIAQIASLLRRRTFCHEGTVAYEVPKWKAPEIDDLTDLLFVESIMKNKASLT